jgi:hypothetical protein
MNQIAPAELRSLPDFFTPFRTGPEELVCLRLMLPKKAPKHLVRDYPTQDSPPISKIQIVAYPHLVDGSEYMKDLRAENKRRGIYCVVNPGGDSDLDITRFVATFSESDPPDGADVAEFIANQLAIEPPLPYSTTMLTHKSLHRYWLIDGPCSREEWLLLQQGQIAYYQSDPAIMNESRVMRLPYFNHVRVDYVNDCLLYKPIELHSFNPDRRYAFAQLQAAFPVGPEGMKKVHEKLSKPQYKDKEIEPSEELRKEVESLRKKPKSSSARSATPKDYRADKITALAEVFDRKRSGESLNQPTIERADYGAAGIAPIDADMIEGTIERICLQLANARHGTKANTLFHCGLILYGLVKGDLADEARITTALLDAVQLAGADDPTFDLELARQTARNAFDRAGETTLENLRQRQLEYAGSSRQEAALQGQSNNNGHRVESTRSVLSVHSVNGVSSQQAAPEEWEQPAPFNEYDLPVFPLDTLPDWLRSYSKGLATATQTPVDMAAMLGLTNCAAAIAGKVIVQVREDWTEPTNIYDVTVLNVGNRKTAVHDDTKAPLEEAEYQMIRDRQAEIDEAKVERSVLEARLEHLKKAAGKADSADKRRKLLDEAKQIAEEIRAINVPAVPKLIVSGDITPEAIASNLAEQDGRLFLCSDEGELFEMLAGRYGNGSNFEIILKAHTGGKVRVDRRGRSEVVENATLTIGLTVQPDVLRGLADKPGFRGRGLIGRFLYCIPKSLVGRRKVAPEPMNDEARSAYSKRVKTLAGLCKVKDVEGELTPRTVAMSRDGLGYLTAFMEEIEPKLAEGGELYPIADWASKLAGAVARIAAILHYADNSLSPVKVSDIPPDTVKRAIEIGRYLVPHAQAAYAEMGADPQIENAKHVLRWIKRDHVNEFTKREALRANRRFKKVTEIEPALELLEAHGYIRTIVRTAEHGKVGRKTSQLFEVNPFSFLADNKDTKDKTTAETLNSVLSVLIVPQAESENFVQKPEEIEPELPVKTPYYNNLPVEEEREVWTI